MDTERGWDSTVIVKRSSRYGNRSNKGPGPCEKVLKSEDITLPPEEGGPSGGTDGGDSIDRGYTGVPETPY